MRIAEILHKKGGKGECAEAACAPCVELVPDNLAGWLVRLGDLSVGG